jgi:hypothetical protein
MRKIILALCCFVSGCAPQRPAPRVVTVQEVYDLSKRLVDCESAKADRYDDGSRTNSDLANLLMAACGVERNSVRQALHIPLNDPETELGEYKDALGIVEDARCARLRHAEPGRHDLPSPCR